MKTSKLKIFTLILAIGSLVSCQKEGCTDINALNYNADAKKNDNSCIYGNNDPYTLSGNITNNKTLDSSHVWTLDGRVSVENGVTLTIEPGTIVKATSGSGSKASSLIIARGAKIMAIGTENSPIIFTSTADNIEKGERYGTNLDQNDQGFWGGVLVLGNAPISAPGNVDQVQIEGIPTSDINGLYGGNDPADNSGTMQYVSIRHGGASIGADNEINGLTLGGVGNGTTIDHIEVVGNVDDGIEFFGGTVNTSELLVWGQGDDGLDIDQAYAGTISNSMVVLSSISDHGLEIDGPEGSKTGSFSLENITIIGAMSSNCNGFIKGEIADYRDGATGTSNNIFVKNFAYGKDIELDNDADASNYTNGILSFSNFEISVPNYNGSNCYNDADSVLTNGTIFNDDSNIGSSFEIDGSIIGKFVDSPTAGIGANENDFSWTFAASRDAF